MKTTGCRASILTWRNGSRADRYETLAICRSLELARAAFKIAIEEKSVE
jgi:hypothetical protein